MNIFDASSLELGRTDMSKEEFVSEIVEKLSEILKLRFPGNPQRQKIKVYRDRINFAAPCCGDSSYSNSKKRGNIILEGPYKNLYKCHNCGRSMNIYSFIKEFGQSLSMNAINYLSVPVEGDASTDRKVKEAPVHNAIYDETEIDSYALDREYFKTTLGLEECVYPTEAYLYLIKRCQSKMEKFLYSRRENMIYVLNLTRTGKILGVQTRPLRYKTYKTYNLSKIYALFLHRTDVEVPDYINVLSMLFNILLVDYRNPVTITEGPMDSFLVRNCIALCGGGKHMEFPFNYRYLYDSDTAGRKYAIEKMREGCSVFLWDKYIADAGLPGKSKWDINDAVIWAVNNKKSLPKVDGYFSSDGMDILDL